jgi:hypothetical protein
MRFWNEAHVVVYEFNSGMTRDARNAMVNKLWDLKTMPNKTHKQFTKKGATKTQVDIWLRTVSHRLATTQHQLQVCTNELDQGTAFMTTIDEFLNKCSDEKARVAKEVEAAKRPRPFVKLTLLPSKEDYDLKKTENCRMVKGVTVKQADTYSIVLLSTAENKWLELKDELLALQAKVVEKKTEAENYTRELAPPNAPEPQLEENEENQLEEPPTPPKFEDDEE